MLEDDARRPRLIETVPKRGYRLAARRSTAGAVPRFAWIVALLIAAIAAGLLWQASDRGPNRPVIAVTDVVNATGDPAYEPLARATSELIVSQLARRGFSVVRAPQGGDLSFTSRLVMWHGRLSLGMTVTGADGVVRWSAMTDGTAERVPVGVSTELDRFERTISAG